MVITDFYAVVSATSAVGGLTPVHTRVFHSSSIALIKSRDSAHGIAEPRMRSNTQARAVRSYVRDRLAASRRADLAEDSVTVVSELFANAVTAQVWQGITTVIPVQASVQGFMVTIDVYDHAGGKPALRPVGPNSVSGRGLHLVHALTDGHWRWEPWGTGKVVAAVLGMTGDPKSVHRQRASPPSPRNRASASRQPRHAH